MNISILETSENECKFLLKNTSGPIANALRRVMLNHIPIFAIDTISSIENTSVLIDEQCIQRLFYIPILSNKADRFKMHDECKCIDNCNECSIPFSIHVENKSKNNITVYDTDIKIEDSDIKTVKETKYNIPITKLAPGQKFFVEGFIKKGLGKDHSKWSPVSTAYYRFMPSIEIKDKKNLTSSQKEELVKVCPSGVFSINVEGKTKIKTKTKSSSVSDIEDLFIDNKKCTMCNECVYKFPQLASVGYLNDTIIFSVESTGVLSVDKIINDSLTFLKELK